MLDFGDLWQSWEGDEMSGLPHRVGSRGGGRRPYSFPGFEVFIM